EIARVAHADRHVPAVAQPRLQRRELVDRHRRPGRDGGAERRGLIERLTGRGVALRRALVEQRQPVLDRAGVELLGLALLRLFALPLLGELLGFLALLLLGELLGLLALLLLVALDRLGDLVGLRLCLLGLGLRLGLGLLRLRLGLDLGLLRL